MVGRRGFSYVCDKFALLKTHVFEHQLLKRINAQHKIAAIFTSGFNNSIKAGILGGFYLFVMLFKEKNYSSCLKRVFSNVLRNDVSPNLAVTLKGVVSGSCICHCKAIFLLQASLDPVILSFYFFMTKVSFPKNLSRCFLPLFS